MEQGFTNPITSLWLSVDPLAEMFPNQSPYNYCFNNPINLTDPTGMAPEGGGDGDPLPVGTVLKGVSHAGDLNEVVVSPNSISGSSVPSSESDKYSYGGTPEQYVKQYGFMTHNEWQEKHGSAWNKYRHQLIREEANERALAHLKVWLTFFDQIEDVAQVMPGSALGNLGRSFGRTFLGGLKGIKSSGNLIQFEQYALRAADDGFYPVMKRGFKQPQELAWLDKGDVWKFGTTKNPFTRYSQKFLDNTGEGLRYTTEFRGIEKNVLKLENMKINNFIQNYGNLPIGNKMIK